ncbi:MAG: hypothetical protein JXQ27_12995 [Acidobacteria bacterium]|nr:hypothetical protein [Acidobacteriota bacterium]
MNPAAQLEKIIAELERGMHLPRCRGCTCQRRAVERFALLLSRFDLDQDPKLAHMVEQWLVAIRGIEYQCAVGTDCPPAAAENTMDSLAPKE